MTGGNLILPAHRDHPASVTPVMAASTMPGGIAPIPVSSGKTNRHRLDRGGNRQVNVASHRVALTRARCHPETQVYMARKRAEGKTHPKQSAVSNATAHDASGTSSDRPPPGVQSRPSPSTS